MDSKQIFEHWSNWAETYGTNLRATTKTGTAKLLELDALARRLGLLNTTESADILEVGCGNGINCISLSKQ
ncbi:class I SAM-dependent methyltransferase, partial [Elstera litoralis]